MAYFRIINPDTQIKTLQPLHKKTTRIGRLSDNDIILKDQRVSRYHAELRHRKNDDYLLKDLYSSNGIKVNGKKMTRRILKENDQIKIGKFFLLFKTATLSKEQLEALQASPPSVDPGKKAAKKDDDQDSVTFIGTISDQFVGELDFDLDDTTVTFPSNEFETIKQPENKPLGEKKTAVGPDNAKTAVPETQLSQETELNPAPTSIHQETKTLDIEPPLTSKEDRKAEEIDTAHEEITPLGPLNYRCRPESLVDLLAKNEVLPEMEMNELTSMAKESSATVCQILSQMALHHRRGIIDILKEDFNLPFIETDDEIVKMYKESPISEIMARKCIALSINAKDEENNKYVPVIMSDPTDLQTVDCLSLAVEKPVKPVFFSTPENIKKAIARIFKSPLEGRVFGGRDIKVEVGKKDYSIEEVTDFPVVDMVNYFIHKAMTERASDIHFEPTEHFFVVRNRIDGVLHEVAALPNYLHPEIVSRFKIMCDMNVAERRLPQDGRFTLSIHDKKLDIRISTFPTVHGEKIVLRLLEQESHVSDIHTLGMEHNEIELLTEKITAPYGMILLTGPTGSGKTTTLYSALSMLNSGDINILTVEDPVEYKIPGVYQMQANEKIGLTFAAGLRTILRQDPDVIMVGEIRDNETAEIAVRASLTGHVVFSTLHTNDAIGIVLRLTDMDIEPFLVASALTMAIAQRLYRTICDDCRTYVQPRIVRERLQEEGITESRLKRLGLEVSEDREYATGKGCPKCKGTGYYGRRALFEMFNVTQEAKDLIISKDFTESALKSLAMEQGMATLLQAGRRAVERGLTTIEEVIRVCRED
jgi:type II secretory ATPase GspE/PulE/Tfp pilus assembly ATPase PilB-like protein/pSer/pThr/pTyr-binding forkhead associated (FHA) protein